MEIRQEVKTILVDMICNNCKEGVLRPVKMLMSNPPKWIHECNNCGCSSTYKVKYPYTEYESIAIGNKGYTDTP